MGTPATPEAFVQDAVNLSRRQTGLAESGKIAPNVPESAIPMLIFLLIGVAGVGIGGYYIKVIRPKQQADIDEDDEE